MPDLAFSVEGAEAVRYAAAPSIVLKLRVTNKPDSEAIVSIALRAQVRIEPARRTYDADEERGLTDLFGARSQWALTLKSFVLAQTPVLVPAFSGSVVVDLPVPCSLDLAYSWAKYFQALKGGQAPLSLLFSGTVFYQDPERGMQVSPVPWEREAAYRLDVRVWNETLDHYFPNLAFVPLRKDVYDALNRHRVQAGFAGWDDLLKHLLEQGEPAP